MVDVLERETIYLWFYTTVLLEMILPYWALGILIGSAISVFGTDRINQAFMALKTGKWGFIGVILAAVLGIASPLCMFGTIPIAASFSRAGMRDDWLAAFMMSSVLLNPQLILYSSALGPTVLAIRVVSCLACGVVAGLLVGRFYRNKPFFDFRGFPEPTNRNTHPNPAIKLLRSIWRNIRATGPYFALGIVLAVLFQRYVPSDAFAGLFGSQRGFGVLMAATIGVPLYMCGGGTIPLLMEWLQGGMGIGAATAFMLTGPATKITNLGALKTVLGGRRFVLYLAFVFVFSIATGLIVDVVSKG